MKTMLRPSSEWAYFLDIDGTLVNLAATPDGIRIDEALRRLINDLHRHCGGAVALVSGRSLAGLDHHLGLAHIPAAGLHGLEWRLGANIAQHSEHAAFGAIEEALSVLCRRYAGIIIENKIGTIALHYRQSPQLGGYLHRWVRRLVRLHGEGLYVQPGKRVIEIRPIGANKGGAIETFMAQFPFAGRTPVFIGDDLTDEHGFAVVNRLGGVSIKVGPGRTSALYRLADVSAVHGWLAELKPMPLSVPNH